MIGTDGTNSSSIAPVYQVLELDCRVEGNIDDAAEGGTQSNDRMGPECATGILSSWPRWPIFRSHLNGCDTSYTLARLQAIRERAHDLYMLPLSKAATTCRDWEDTGENATALTAAGW